MASVILIGGLAAVGGFALADLWQVYSFWKWPEIEAVAASPLLHLKRYLAFYELYSAVLFYLMLNHPRLFGLNRESNGSRHGYNYHDGDIQGALAAIFCAGWTFLHCKALWIFCRGGLWRDPWVWPWMLSRGITAFISLCGTWAFGVEFPRRVSSMWKYFRLRYWP